MTQQTIADTTPTTRTLQQGSGPRIGFVAGFTGLPRSIPFLAELARTREVVAPSLPGFPGGGAGHKQLHSHLDWILATRDMLVDAGLWGCDLVASSVGAGLVAEVAALWPDAARSLTLCAPFGVCQAEVGARDPWAERAEGLGALLCTDASAFDALWQPSSDSELVDTRIALSRAVEASARIFFPLGDRGLAQRLPRISMPTQLIWGEADRLLPQASATLFERAIPGCTAHIVAGAGHLVELDRPHELARLVLSFSERVVTA